MAEPLAALLWDVDGTLAETELDGHRLAFNAAFEEQGLPWRWDGPFYRRLLAISGGRERLSAFLAQAEGEPPDPERVAVLQRCKQLHYGALLQRGELPLRPGVARLVREAQQAGLRQGIVTTSGRPAVAALAAGALADLADAFSFWICGDDVRAKKPDPEAYRLAILNLGLPAGQLLAIEDSPQGFAAATAAGLDTLVTLSCTTADQPLERFAGARAVLDGLGDPGRPADLLAGVPCPEGQVTLSYLQRLRGDV
jgi:HAD superfamily hydrolase (TIGR01509 family)